MKRRRSHHLIPNIREKLFLRDGGVCAHCAEDTVKKCTRWEAHHVIAVCEGGDSLDLENYETVCVPCHKIETDNLRKRIRAKGLRWGRPPVDPEEKRLPITFRMAKKNIDVMQAKADLAGIPIRQWMIEKLLG